MGEVMKKFLTIFYYDEDIRHVKKKSYILKFISFYKLKNIVKIILIKIWAINLLISPTKPSRFIVITEDTNF